MKTACSTWYVMADQPTLPPLSPQDRAKVFAILAAGDATLADRVAVLLDERDDPIVRLLTEHQQKQGSSIQDAVSEFRAQMRQLVVVVVVVSVIAMALNAGLVGVSMSTSSRFGTLTVNQRQQQEQPTEPKP